MRKDFFPKRESDIPSWTQGFGQQLVESGEQFGVSPQAAAHFMELRESFVNLYMQWATSAEAGIRSKPLTSSKSAAGRSAKVIETPRSDLLTDWMRASSRMCSAMCASIGAM